MRSPHRKVARRSMPGTVATQRGMKRILPPCSQRPGTRPRRAAGRRRGNFPAVGWSAIVAWRSRAAPRASSPGHAARPAAGFGLRGIVARKTVATKLWANCTASERTPSGSSSGKVILSPRAISSGPETLSAMVASLPVGRTPSRAPPSSTRETAGAPSERPRARRRSSRSSFSASRNTCTSGERRDSTPRRDREVAAREQSVQIGPLELAVFYGGEAVCAACAKPRRGGEAAPRIAREPTVTGTRSAGRLPDTVRQLRAAAGSRRAHRRTEGRAGARGFLERGAERQDELLQTHAALEDGDLGRWVRTEDVNSTSSPSASSAELPGSDSACMAATAHRRGRRPGARPSWRARRGPSAPGPRRCER